MQENTLLIIPCCALKNPGGITEYDKSNCIVRDLSTESGKKLMELRRQVAIFFREPQGPDLGFIEAVSEVKYMKAYERYCGNLYSRISKDSWSRLSHASNLKLVIVSALYGLLNHDEMIRNYDKKMDRDKIYGALLKTWWNNHGLSSILLDYVTQNRIEVIHDFLSAHYADALRTFPLMARKVGVKYVYHNYHGLGSGSDYHRGREINVLIQALGDESYG